MKSADHPSELTVLPGAIPVQLQITFPGVWVDLPFLRIGGVRDADNKLARNQLHLAGDKLIEAAVALGYMRMMPDSHGGYVQQAKTMFGDAFASALHVVRRSILALRDIDGFTSVVNAAASGLDNLYPAVKGVRDSAAHVDERVQGKARVPGKAKSTRITPQMQTINIGGSTLTVPGNVGTIHINGTESFGHGGADGLIELVSMQESDLLKAVEIVQELVNAFPWKGSPDVIPRKPF